MDVGGEQGIGCGKVCGKASEAPCGCLCQSREAGGKHESGLMFECLGP